MKPPSPAQSLVLLLLAAGGASGWFYGLHWKRVAGGDGFTDDERHMMRLQEQIEILTERNADLNAALAELREAEEPDPPEEPEENRAAPGAPAGDPAPPPTGPIPIPAGPLEDPPPLP